MCGIERRGISLGGGDRERIRAIFGLLDERPTFLFEIGRGVRNRGLERFDTFPELAVLMLAGERNSAP
jgi:hypothetical protein